MTLQTTDYNGNLLRIHDDTPDERIETAKELLDQTPATRATVGEYSIGLVMGGKIVNFRAPSDWFISGISHFPASGEVHFEITPDEYSHTVSEDVHGTHIGDKKLSRGAYLGDEA